MGVLRNWAFSEEHEQDPMFLAYFLGHNFSGSSSAPLGQGVVLILLGSPSQAVKARLRGHDLVVSQNNGTPISPI